MDINNYCLLVGAMLGGLTMNVYSNGMVLIGIMIVVVLLIIYCLRD